MRDKFCVFIVAMLLASVAAGQTQVDLKNQSKSADFAGASFTRPAATGASLPATCSVGQMFFLTSAPAGQNVYGCSTTNTWTTQFAGAQSTTISNAGTVIGSTPEIDFSAGLGSVVSASNTGTEILLQTSIDTSVVETTAGNQSGTALYCNSSSTASPGQAYLCSLTPALTAYTTGMVLNWRPDITVLGNATTLNVSALGAIPVVASDGVTALANGSAAAGVLYPVWYDGTSFRMPAGSVQGSSGGGDVSTVALGTAVLGTAAIASGACAPTLTVTATGVLSVDTINWNPNASLTTVTGYAASTTGGLSIAVFPAANSVNFDVCNWSPNAITPGAVSINWAVRR